MRTHNSRELLKKIKQRIPDAEERLVALRAQTRAEIEAYSEIEEAIAARWQRREHLTDLPDVASVFSLIGETLEGIGADFTIRVRLADGREIDVLPEDLAAMTTFSAQLPDLVGTATSDSRTKVLTENGVSARIRDVQNQGLRFSNEGHKPYFTTEL